MKAQTIAHHLKSTVVANFRRLAFLLAISFSPLLAQAANVTLTASDPGGSSSLTSAGTWSNASAPNATNDYFTGAFFARTPADSGNITTTFAGHSLTLQNVIGGGQGSPQRSILFKGGNGDTIVINNLTNAAGGVLNNGGSGVVTPTFTGNLWTIAANSTLLSDQGSTIIGYPLAGSDGVILTNTSGQARTITYTGNLSGFTGKFYIISSLTVALNSGSSNLGNPATFTPDQIYIGAGCTLQDNVGITFNNINGGFTLGGNATINAASSSPYMTIAEPITDSGSNYSLTISGAGAVSISAHCTYSGGTTISSGSLLQLAVANALTNTASVTDNGGILDLDAISATINGLNGSGGTVDNSASGTPMLTVGSNGGGGTFSGVIQNTTGSVSLMKVGAGTETLAGGYTYSGATVVAGGTLALNTAVSSGPGDLIVSNGAVLSVNASSGNSLSAGNLVFGNGTNSFNYGTLAANPTSPAINATGGISAPGANIVITIAATGLQPGTFTLIKYTGTPLASIANFQVSPPPGVAATLVNDTGNDSIDLQVTQVASQLTWNGVNGSSWDLTTPNWLNASSALTVFQQYTNNGAVAGDGVTFDDSVVNNATNITLNSTFYAFPVFVNTTQPYSIAGTGGITGVTSLLITNTGSMTLLTSNSFTGGVNISGGTLIITNDSALGASSGSVTLNSGTLQINGGVTNSRAFPMPVASTISVATNVTASLGGTISGAGASFNVSGNGTLILTGRETFAGDMFLHTGTTIIGSGGSITNSVYDDVGQNTTDTATLTLQGTGSLSTANDFNLGDLDSSIGTLNISGSATLTMNQFFIGSANAAGSTAMGIVNQTGGTITEVSTAVGAFAIGGRTSALGVGVYNMNGGTVIANAGVRVGGTGTGTLNLNGGKFNALLGINIARIAGSFGTNNLNGGTLATYNVASSTGVNAIFNFNGGTLQAAFNPPTPWMSGLSQANILAGGAIIDSSNFNVTITQPLLAGSAGGGLTKKGNGTLTLSGVNTFTGPITNSAGTLFLNSASTYAGGAVVNAGTLQMTTASVIQGTTTVGNNALLSINQVGSATTSLGNLTFNGAATGPGATLGLTPTTSNNPNVAMVNCGTLTLNGTNTISLAAVGVGTTALIQYTGTIAGSGNITNLSLPQGATGYVSNNVANSTLYLVVTSTGPGLVWTGTNSVSPNLWDIGTTTNWVVNSTPTSYHQIITPGDAVVFNDNGSGVVTLNTTVAPASMVISNNSLTYTFSGSGGISGSTGLLKLGGAAAILNLTNDSYTGDTIISNGTLQVVNNGTVSALSPAANLTIGASGTLQLSSQAANVTTAVGEFTGSGLINYSGGINSILAFGSASGGTWNGTIQSGSSSGLSLTKNGSGTWVIGGTNHLNNGDFFNAVSQNQFNNGTTIITNGGLITVPFTEFWIAEGVGSTSTVVVAGGTLSVSNNNLTIGRDDTTANGTLIINSGTIQKAGNGNLIVGGSGAANGTTQPGTVAGTGTLIVNGGQVLDSSPLYVGQNGSGTLQINGGLVQASQITANGTATASTANFNGGTLQAATNSTDFIDASTTASIQGGGLILDDGGFTISMTSGYFQDPTSSGGSLIKKGAGTVYFDTGNTYTGTTMVTNGTLAGVGYVTGPLVIAPAGNLGAGDAGAVGTFEVGGNLTLQGKATFRIDKTGGTPLQPDQIGMLGSISYGGALVISNITSDANVLAVGDTFQLFTQAGTENPIGGTGNFTSIIGSPGAGLAYSFNPSTGTLSVVTAAASPTGLKFTANPVISGTSLTISATNTGAGTFYLLTSTNIASPLNTWTTVWTNTAGGSGTVTTNLSNAVNPALGQQFYILSTTNE